MNSFSIRIAVLDRVSQQQIRVYQGIAFGDDQEAAIDDAYYFLEASLPDDSSFVYGEVLFIERVNSEQAVAA